MNVAAHVVTKTLDGRIIERFRNGKLLDDRGIELDWTAAEMLSEADLNARGIFIVEHPMTPPNEVMESYKFFLDGVGVPQIEVVTRPLNAFEIKQEVNTFRKNVETGFRYKYMNLYLNGSVAEYAITPISNYPYEIVDYDLNVVTVDGYSLKDRLGECIANIRASEIEVFKDIEDGKHLNPESAKMAFYKKITSFLLDKELGDVKHMVGNENGIA